MGESQLAAYFAVAVLCLSERKTHVLGQRQILKNAKTANHFIFAVKNAALSIVSNVLHFHVHD